MGAIVVGYDGSDSSRAALGTAIEVAKALGDKVHVVMAYEVNRFGGEVQDYANALRERAEQVLKLASDQAAGLGAEIETEIVEASPPDALIAVADQLDARVIVVGTRGESPLKGALVGSTPHKLIQITDRPLLVVPGQ
jgi:nucleotide-binding universal stress UspA family protein